MGAVAVKFFRRRYESVEQHPTYPELPCWKRSIIRLYSCYTLPMLLTLAVVAKFGAWQWAAKVLLLHLLLWAAVLLPLVVLRRIRDYGARLYLPHREQIQDAAEEQLHSQWSIRKVELVTGRKVWEQEKVLPVAKTAAALLNRVYHPDDARTWVNVPRDFREPGGAPVEIQLPGNFATVNEAARKRLVTAAAERLGMRDPSATWQLEGEHPRLLLRAPVLPPKEVSFADVLPALERSKEYSFLLGMAGAETLSVDLKEDTPHFAVSAGSGAGKSELLKFVVAQALHWGWFVIILDWKEESQEWADGLPGVRYVRSIQALHDTCVDIGEEVEYRKADRGGPRIKTLILSEEWGITAPLLADYWQERRSLAETPEERRAMPTKSPAAGAMMKLNFTGRSLGMHQGLVAQRFSARVTNGNADLRESFGMILMSRWKSQTVKMLAPDVKPFPKKITKPGQWAAVIGDTAVVFQAPLLTDEEAREWATTGEPNPASPWVLRGAGQVDRSDLTEPRTLGDQLGLALTGPNADYPEADYLEGEIVEPQKLMKLSAMVDSLDHLAMTLNILQKAAKVDLAFPPVRGGSQFSGYLYDLYEVRDWAIQKRAAEAAERVRK
jgi:hypothetical protein